MILSSSTVGALFGAVTTIQISGCTDFPRWAMDAKAADLGLDIFDRAALYSLIW